MDIVAKCAAQVLIRICGLHGVDGGQQSGLLVYRVALGDDILDDGAQLVVTASVEPLGDTAVVQIAY